MDAKSRAYMDAVVADYLNNDARIVGVLANLRLDAAWILAIHIYCKRIRIRGWDWFNNQWTPSDKCINDAMKGPNYKEYQRCIQGVTSNFTKQPGMDKYTLSVNPRRTLTDQIALWHGNQYTGPRGHDVLVKVEKKLKSSGFPDPPTVESKAAFVKWFVAMDDPEVTNAAPGLTDHGLMQAVDFVVIPIKGGGTVAGTSTKQASIDRWEGREKGYPDFSSALKKAVRQFNDKEPKPRFASEHLKSPYEPWHYTYLGQVVDRTMSACHTGVEAKEEVHTH